MLLMFEWGIRGGITQAVHKYTHLQIINIWEIDSIQNLKAAIYNI